MKLSQILAIAGWMSVFIEMWLILLERIPQDKITWWFLFFFLFIAIAASAIASPNEKGK